MSEVINLQDKIKAELMDISGTINEIVESYKQLHNPLVETQENVPKATEQLDKISEQTEAATHRMLDTAEIITQREDEVIAGLNKIKTLVQENEIASIETVCDEIAQKASDNSNDAFVIMDALQFQDITSQQIDHAVVLLEDLGLKLHKILTVLGGESVQDTTIRKKRAFDPHADLFDKKTNQTDIDSLFAKK